MSRIAVAVVAGLMILVGELLPIPFRNKAYTSVNLHALGSFPFDADHDSTKDVPAVWRALDGKKVRLRGMMYAQGTPVTHFQLVYELSHSGPGGPPGVQERVFATSTKDLAKVYDAVNESDDGLVELVGTLHVKAVHDRDGTVISLFQLDVERVAKAGELNVKRPTAFAVGEQLVRCGVGILIVMAIAEFFLLIRRYPNRAGHLCPVCGYDLRASADRCPECGTAISRSPIPPAMMQ